LWITYQPSSSNERPDAVIQPWGGIVPLFLESGRRGTTPMSHFSNQARERWPKMKSVAPSM
jgi:hypothetical protein